MLVLDDFFQDLYKDTILEKIRQTLVNIRDYNEEKGLNANENINPIN